MIEIIADCQLQAHRKTHEGNEKRPVMCSGLWRYSRHPNFFGEMLCWWGLYIVSLGGTSGEKGGVWTFGGALLISLLLRFHSGVKMLELRQMKKPEYRVYAQETNIFTPWCYTAIEGDAREIAL